IAAVDSFDIGAMKRSAVTAVAGERDIVVPGAFVIERPIVGAEVVDGLSLVVEFRASGDVTEDMDQLMLSNGEEIELTGGNGNYVGPVDVGVEIPVGRAVVIESDGTPPGRDIGGMGGGGAGIGWAAIFDDGIAPRPA